MKKRFRKILRRTAWIFGGILIFLILLHTPPVRNFIKGFVTKKFSSQVGGTLRVGHLDYKLWKGEASVADVELEMPGLRAQVDNAVISFFSRKGILIEAKKPRVALQPVQSRKKETPQKAAPSTRPWLFLRKIGSIILHEAQFVLSDARGDIQVRGSLSLRRRDAYGDIWTLDSQVQCSFPGRENITANLNMALALEEKKLQIREFLLRSGQTSLAAQGVLIESNPFQGNLDGRFQIEDSLTRYFAPDLPVAGTVHGRFQARMQESGLAGQADLEARQIYLTGLGPWSLQVRSRIEGSQILIDSFELSGSAGTIAASGSADLEQERIQARIKAIDLDPNSLIANWIEIPVAISSRIGADVQFSLKNWQIDGAEAEGEILFSPVKEKGIPLSGKMTCALDRDRLRIDSKNLEILNGRVSFSGNVEQNDLRGTYRLGFALSDFRWIANALNVQLPDVQADGYLDVSGEIGGSFQEPSVTARLTTEELQIADTPLSLAADLVWARQALRVKEAEITSGPGNMKVQGVIPTTKSAQEWDLTAKLESVELSDLIDVPGFDILANGTAHLKENEIALDELKLDFGGGTLTAAGQYHLGTQKVQGRVTGSGFQINEMRPLIEELGTVEGSLSLDMAFQGSISSPEAQMNLDLDSLVFDGMPLPGFSFAVKLDGDMAEIKGFSQELFLEGSCRLKEPFLLRLALDLGSFPVKDLLSIIPTVSHVDLASAKGTLFLDLPIRNPEALRYRANIEGIDVRYGKNSWNISPFTAEGSLRSVDLEGFRLQEKAGSVVVDGQIPLNSEEEFGVEMEGTLDLGFVGAFLPAIELEGLARVQFQISGTAAEPQIQGEATISNGSGSWQNIAWEDLVLRITGTKEDLRLDTLSMKILDGLFRAEGRFVWKDRGEDSKASFSFENLNPRALLQNQKTGSSPSLRVSGKGMLKASGLSLAALSGSGSLTRIDTDIGEPPVSLQEPAEWILDGGRFSLSTARFAGENSDLAASLEFRADKSPPEWKIRIQGRLNSSLSELLIDDANLNLSGETHVEIDLESLAGSLKGRASLDGGRLALKDLSFFISQLRTRLIFQGRSIEVSEITGQVGSGKFRISGKLELSEESSLPKTDLQIEAENIPLNPSDGIYSRFSGKIRLADEEEHYTLSGDIKIHRLLFEKELDSKSWSLSQLERQIKSVQQEPALMDRISFDLKADVEDFRLDNSLGQVEGAGILSITGSPALTEFNGSFQVETGGIFRLGRARINISEGQIVLNNFPDNQPEVNLSGRSSVSGIWIELNVRGRIDDLQTQLSAPDRTDLTEGDLAILLLTGRTPSTAVSEARNIAAEELAASLGNLLQKGLGDKIYIDISPDDFIYSQDSDPTTRFSLGHQIAAHLYIVYSTALNGTKRRAILDYRPNRPVRFRYIAEEDGRAILEANHSLGLRLSRQHQKDGGIERYRIESLSFEGELPFKERKLRKWVRLKPGKRFKDLQAFRGAQKIQRMLVKRGYRSASVEFEEKETSPGRIEIVYFIESGKRILFSWTGDRVSNGLRKKIEAIWEGHLAEDMLPEILAHQAEYALRAKKYYAAQVTSTTTRTEHQLVVRLDVRKGPQGRGVVLRFEGNQAMSDRRLAQILPRTTSPDFFETLDGEAPLMQRAVDLLYVSEGFIDVNVGRPQVEFSHEAGKLFVTVPVTEGLRALVESIALPSDTIKAVESGDIELRLRKDEPFRIEDYLEDRTTLSAHYKRLGFNESKVTGILKPIDDRIAVAFEVDRGSKKWVGEIRRARPAKSRDSFIEKALTLEKGDLILPSELALSRKRLLDTQVIQSVNFRRAPSEQGPQIQDLIVDIVEKPDITLDYGLRFTLERSADEPENIPEEDYSVFQIGGRVAFLNPFGYGHRYGASAYVFGKEQFFRVLFNSEYFFRLNIPTQIFFSMEQTRRLEVSGIESNIQKITFQQYYRWGENFDWRRWGDKLRLQWNYSFRKIRLTALTDERTAFDIETDRGSISLALIGDTRDNFINPSRGIFWSVSTEFSRKWMASDVNFNKIYGQAFLYLPLGGGMIFATGLRMGAVPGENPLLIIEDRFVAGGPNSVRGFRLNSLGPKTEDGEPLGGQAVVVFNAELRFPIHKSLHGGIFYDTGNTFVLTREMTLKDLRHSAGLGLRFMLPFGPIRLDWAYVLDRKPGEGRSRLVFTLGHAF